MIKSVVVSACLLGDNVKYSGGNNFSEQTLDFVKDKCVLKVCPEMSGGLGCPREPAEIKMCGEIKKVFTKSGREVTEAFVSGAKAETENVLAFNPDCAVLKSNSPSCGINAVYDGTFTGKLIPGSGVFADMLKEKGILLISPEEL